MANTLPNKLTKKILIVDDDSNIRYAVRLIIEEQEYIEAEVTGCANVSAAIESIKQSIPDIIILDLHMPDKTGFEFMDYLRKDTLYNAVQVIMLTVDDTLDTVLAAEAKGIDPFHFLGKPFNISELQALVLKLSLPTNTDTTHISNLSSFQRS